jgi:hypothetical protein
MAKYFHIVQVHPVELVQPNLAKVRDEREFEEKADAIHWMQKFNDAMHDSEESVRAVYHGRVNDETGELE